jgi:hypothetical protein
MIVTFPPGSANDAAAWIFADALSTRWHQPVVVENRAGAEGSIGVSGFVAAHDDHAILCTVAGAVTVTPLLLDKLSYGAATDLIPLASTTSAVLAVAVTGGRRRRTLPISSPWRSRNRESWRGPPGLHCPATRSRASSPALSLSASLLQLWARVCTQ